MVPLRNRSKKSIQVWYSKTQLQALASKHETNMRATKQATCNTRAGTFSDDAAANVRITSFVEAQSMQRK